MRKLLRIVPVVALTLLAACSGAQMVTEQVVEVEGRVNVRGNEPFTAVVLQTDDNNYYVLTLSEEQRAGLVNPSRQRVRGVVYAGEWNGQRWAHLRVQALERR